MTDVRQDTNGEAPMLPDPLPTLVTVTTAFSSRMPSQRVIDALSRAEGASFGDIIRDQPFRVVAFRALMRERPGYDLTAAWLHAYDVEVEVEDVDPTSLGSLMPEPPSGITGTSTPTP